MGEEGVDGERALGVLAPAVVAPGPGPAGVHDVVERRLDLLGQDAGEADQVAEDGPAVKQ